MTDLSKVFTIQEAAERFGLSADTLKKYCGGMTCHPKGKPAYKYPPKFLPGEYRLAGRTWLITLEGLERVFRVSEKEKEV